MPVLITRGRAANRQAEAQLTDDSENQAAIFMWNLTRSTGCNSVPRHHVNYCVTATQISENPQLTLPRCRLTIPDELRF